jgi:hypothetical protein
LIMHPGGNWTSSQILNGWLTLSQALHGLEPYSAARVTGVLPVPTPHFDFWWAGWGPRGAVTGVVISALVAQLAVALVVVIVWIRECSARRPRVRGDAAVVEGGPARIRTGMGIAAPGLDHDVGGGDGRRRSGAGVGVQGARSEARAGARPLRAVRQRESPIATHSN